MLQTRPSSTEAFQNGTQGQQHQRGSHLPRNMYGTSMGGMATASYRGHTSMAPSAPYNFAPPSASSSNGANPLRQHPTVPSYDNRAVSAPVIPLAQQSSFSNALFPSQGHQTTNTSVSSTPNLTATFSTQQKTGSKDDTSIASSNSVSHSTNPTSSPRPLSAIDINSQATTSTPTTSKPTPDRYRRSNRRVETNGAQTGTGNPQGGSAPPSGSGMATVSHLYNHPLQTNSTPTLTSYPSYRGSPSPSRQVYDQPVSTRTKVSSVDDLNLPKPGSSEQAKRYRRRSITSLNAEDYANFNAEQSAPTPPQPKTYAAMLASPAPQESTPSKPVIPPQRPGSSHGRNESAESSSSTRSGSRPSSRREASNSSNPAPMQATVFARNEAKVVNIPPRGSSDASKRLTNPSPLSKPIQMSPESSSSKQAFAAAIQQKPQESHAPSLNPSSGNPESPAAQHLAALNKKEGKKEGKSSRLRRAFSFGSAAELRKATAENNLSTERAKLRKERYQDEEEAQQAAIAQKQEAAGLGEGIYSGQGHFFTGSTDNLSISSTASSASVMIRKMGKGVKKGGRSLVGLFRPKSIVGVPPADAPAPEASVAQVSMVTVEAEREKVNVNVDPHDQAGGGTGFPKLERNSLDTARVASDSPGPARERSFDTTRARRSIVGGEKERAEVLAAVKKGILKRTGTDSGNSSPVSRPADTKPDFAAPQLPHISDSPASSSPSTPVDDHARPGHRRTDSISVEGEDYFVSLANYASGDCRSVPGTPRSVIARNISFSPRIQFHDTWTSGEYDRRGEIATCNRLTPMLAQQIKEELNTFKMEMEVHEQSKVHTHFF
ncbi:MAG: hypothetical protein Q9167_007867 [Letrouitia subvulpina]